MNEPTEFKYSLDEYGEPYFAGSHVKAIKGMDDIETRLNAVENTQDDLISVTGWYSYADNVAKGVKVNEVYSGSNGLKCELKEVRIGIEGVTPVVRYKTITYNLKNFKLGEQVAQFPQGFMTKPHVFPAFGQGDRGAYRVEITNKGEMIIWGGMNNKDLDTELYWIYGQYTWIE